jgi:tetratricopeptide (TPR) repeat protein
MRVRSLPLLCLLGATLTSGVRAQGAEPCGEYVRAFERGLSAYNAGARDVARAAWNEAVEIEVCGPDVAYNLAVLAVIADDLGGAEHLYVTALDRLDAWPDSVQRLPEGRHMRAGLYTGLLNVGARHFVADAYAPALAAFARITARDRLHRDAWYNQALTLYHLERWRDLVPVAEHVLTLDPLNVNAHAVLLRAHRGLRDVRAARSIEAATAALPVGIHNLQIATEGHAQTLTGQMTGRHAASDTPIRLAFTLVSPEGPLATQEVVVPAPRKGQTSTFEVRFLRAPGATAVRYRVVEAGMR